MRSHSTVSRCKGAVALLALCLLVLLPANTHATDDRLPLGCGLLTDDPASLRTIARTMLDEANEIRARAGLRPWRLADGLTRIAQGHARFMAGTGEMTHLGLDDTIVQDRAERIGYDWQTIGENISRGQVTVRQAVESWMNSIRHKTLILHEDITEMGAGFAIGEDVWLSPPDSAAPRAIPGCYWVMVGARPD